MQGVARNDLQLLSVACMLVAAKHEEVGSHWIKHVCMCAAAAEFPRRHIVHCRCWNTPLSLLSKVRK